MHCPRCGVANGGGRRFCAECGSPLSLPCPSCRFANEPPAKFCGGCGAPLSAAPAETRSDPRAPEVPKHLAERILTSRSALEGERKQVTVLLADLKGSMELLAERDPEEGRSVLDPVLELMMEAVHRFEGTVNQVMGDGIMALFGAPLAHEDHAVRACYAALQMQESVRRYAAGISSARAVPIQIRIGLNSGEVVVRAIGSDLHMDYTAVGQTTHLAGRMEQMAAPGTILITAATKTLADEHVRVVPIGPTPIKGLEAPIDVYELAGAVPMRPRWPGAAATGRARFVGRDAEMGQLQRALERAAAGHGQIVAAVGEPGVGKSRLYWEFTDSLRTGSWLLLESSAVSFGRATPYLPVIELLRTYAQVEARDDGRTIREKVTGRVRALDRSLETYLPALLSLLDVGADDGAWRRLDPSQRRQRTLDGVKRLLLRESQNQPLVLVVENLHWIDTETQTLLDGLVESLPTARILLLVNYRPEYHPAWTGKTYYRQLRIDTLPQDSADDLLTDLLGTDRRLEQLKRLLVEQTEGNPLFLEESVRTLVETKALVGERGAYRLLPDIKTVTVPATVQAILAARIDRLAPEDKRLLQAAAVVGKHVPLVLLQAIAEMPEDEVPRGLARLQAAEFLYETRLFPDLEYTFNHTLTHEVAYGTLLQHRRRGLHARIVETLESLSPDRLAGQVDLLAHHARQGELWDKALGYFRQAGTRALQRSAYREAVACFQEALSALHHLPDSRGSSEAAIDLRLDIRLALFPLAESEPAQDHMQEAEALALRLDEPFRLFRVYNTRTIIHLWAAEYEHAIEAGQRAATIAEGLGTLGPKITAEFQLGAAYLGSGQYQQASTLHMRNIVALQEEMLSTSFGFGTGTSAVPLVRSERPGLAWVHALAAMSQAECGNLREARALASEARRAAEQVERPVDIVIAALGVGWVSLHAGEVTGVISLLERARDLCRDLGLLRWRPFVTAVLGYAHAQDARPAEALSLLREAVEEASARGILFYHARWVLWTGAIHSRLGELDRALPLVHQAVELARARKERGTEAWALRLLGEISLHADSRDPETAQAHYRQAMALAEDLGMRPLVAHCHLGLVAASLQAGKRDEARRHQQGAAAMFREMEMKRWLELAEAQRGELA